MHIETAVGQLAPSVAAEGLEVFAARNANTARGRRCSPTWRPVRDAGSCTWRDVSLMRAKTGVNRFRYFLGRVRPNSALFEGPVVNDYLRFQFGLAALTAQPLTVDVQQRGETTCLRLPLPAPTVERRLLIALCEADQSSMGHTWLCRGTAHLSVLRASLQQLGCEFVEHE